MSRKKLVTVPERVAELVEEHGSYRDAARATGIATGNLHAMGVSRMHNPSVLTLKKLGLKATHFERA